MKNYIKYIGILALGMVACEPEFENPVDEQGTYSSGEADFTNYVALGNSLTAGYADNALYITGQENSYPNILAQQFARVQETGVFRQPLMADNAGGLLAGEQQITGNRLVLETVINGQDTVQAPKVFTGMRPTTNVLNKLQGSFNNMGVPGARSFHLLAPGYGNPAGLMANPATANPYFVRFASSAETSVVQDAVAQQPTFFSLWIGNNDVLGYATSGGLNEASITDPQTFAGAYSQIVTSLVESGAEEGVLLNIPDVTDVPFFTTIPNNALVLSAEQAANLTGFFQAVAGIFTQVLVQQQQVPQEQAAQIASQYAINFSAGPNRFIIDVPVTQSNPLGFRQMTEDELLLFTIDRSAIPTQGYGSAAVTPQVMEVLGILQAGGQPTPEQAQLVLGAVNGIDDADALDADEIENIRVATSAYNETIRSIAQSFGLAHVDAAALLGRVAGDGIAFDAGRVTSEFGSGGAFSLDGIHLTPRGYALVANSIIDEINATYNSSVPKVNIGNYGTITPSNSVGQ